MPSPRPSKSELRAQVGGTLAETHSKDGQIVRQHENWRLPLAVVPIVPMRVLASVTGPPIRGLAIDILARIGFVVLVGLAAKNAILIAEFPRQAEDGGGGCASRRGRRRSAVRRHGAVEERLLEGG